MQTLKNLLNKPWRPTPNWLILAWSLVSLVGFLDATYLTVQHYTGGAINCNIFSGCEKVLASQYAVIWGTPLALVGAIFYLVMLLLMLLYWDQGVRWALLLAMLGSVGGFIFSLIMTYLQVVVIESLCQYCLLSVATATTLFVFSLWGLRQQAIAQWNSS